MTVHGSRCLKRCAKTTLSGIPSSLKYGKRDPDTILGIIYYMYVYRKYLNAKETGLGRYTCEQGKNNIEGLVPIYNVIPFNIAFSHFFFKKATYPSPRRWYIYNIKHLMIYDEHVACFSGLLKTHSEFYILLGRPKVLNTQGLGFVMILLILVKPYCHYYAPFIYNIRICFRVWQYIVQVFIRKMSV